MGKSLLRGDFQCVDVKTVRVKSLLQYDLFKIKIQSCTVDRESVGTIE